MATTILISVYLESIYITIGFVYLTDLIFYKRCWPLRPLYHQLLISWFICFLSHPKIHMHVLRCCRWTVWRVFCRRINASSAEETKLELKLVLEEEQRSLSQSAQAKPLPPAPEHEPRSRSFDQNLASDKPDSCHGK